MAGSLATSLRGLWVSGLLPLYNGGLSARASTRKPTRRGRLGHRAGIPKRKLTQLPTRKGTLESAWAASTHCEGKGPENPSVVAPLAAAGCRGNRRRVVDRRLGKIDLRPCPLRLRSSLLVLGCTGLMRSTLFPFSSTVTEAWNMSIAIPELASLLRHCPKIYACLANLADNHGILALGAVGVIASSCFVGPSSSWGVLSSQAEFSL